MRQCLAMRQRNLTNSSHCLAEKKLPGGGDKMGVVLKRAIDHGFVVGCFFLALRNGFWGHVFFFFL